MADDSAVDPSRGLTGPEAAARLAAEGANELPAAGRRDILRIVLEVLREPMLALLIGGGVIYSILGSLAEALVLLVFAGLSVAITVVQESRTERVLEALRDLSAPQARVVRDGAVRLIAGREVVRGDILVLADGDRIAADAVIVDGWELEVDESLLTGESVAVHKRPAAADEALVARRPGGADLPNVYAGTFVVRGQGRAQVIATGPAGEIGRIGKSLDELTTEPPRLRQQMLVIVRWCAIGGGGVALAVVGLYGLLRGSWLDALLAGIAIGMSMLPEEFPVVLTVFLAMGARRISEARVLTRRAAAIETLGSATVLCTDKTGTLTRNRMTIAELHPDGRAAAAAEDDAAALALVACGRLASSVDPTDPMEKAFFAHPLAAAATPAERPLHTWGISRDLLAVTNLWPRAAGAPGFRLAAKGAPEAIAGLCRLPEAARTEIRATVETMAAAGLRVLGVAEAETDGIARPAAPGDVAFAFLGLVGLADPLREGVPAAVAECRAAGIRVVMITGDHPATARAIAAGAGIGAERVVTGTEMSEMSDADLALRVRDTSVFARILPEQKLRIVEALKSDGEVVGMTGDGVNDAPSLKAAHIGIAMGGRGTDVARQAASMVLLDDDFGSIVRAIRLGRRIYDNLRKAMGFIFAIHVPIAGLALMPLMLGLPLLFGPMHIAVLEMVIDPVCSLVFEAEIEEANVMKRPPRDPAAPLFSIPLVVWSVLQGVLAFATVAAITLFALHRGMPETEVRALAFFSLIMALIGLALVNRSFGTSLVTALIRPNAALIAVLVGIAAIAAVTLTWPPASRLFRFGPLHGDDLLVTLAAGALVLVVLEGLKRPFRARFAA
ncbi:cation-translocating P-type ATPase [Siculibacillus lacustris]|uniref:Cation-translocating P-type ATPase n=1 Tax=Siculibacillus lacustris TaxID=1549641 RepID=A0A4Q9VRE6_9HYPH|nr:cation-translocating P-type ATPase [Siculibacillus lacustris]TBW38471.1 cation-translocating P-type ATPase [Siculibacillus lacustris]